MLRSLLVSFSLAFGIFLNVWHMDMRLYHIEENLNQSINHARHVDRDKSPIELAYDRLIRTCSNSQENALYSHTVHHW
jgi:hypothetical protein